MFKGRWGNFKDFNLSYWIYILDITGMKKIRMKRKYTLFCKLSFVTAKSIRIDQFDTPVDTITRTGWLTKYFMLFFLYSIIKYFVNAFGIGHAV